MKIWFDKPAEAWPSAFPIGNGTLGGMVSGGTIDELIQLNEDTLWSGRRVDSVNKNAKDHLGHV